ncbi:tRNA-dihydrouridine synthase family protein [Ruminiclostridium herbifermentans]|uniref:tRNA-dihydrouridine synthase n=1 Tax=Ruminiclostridium herbifermentans TaxID=2488810 RepID=A0A4U7JFI6_9FIRM|nr:tRNA-dihydrouridine synthase family protein [Ruminiclostridium herbifermentans]QNU67710.1 tRNA-dihydrouridine synthase family protein [Ruminiclostridium herbifermentans]
MNLFLAPIQGMTIACYRNLFSELFGGIDAYYAPFIATADMDKVNPVLLKDIMVENNNKDIKIIPQILSNNGTEFKLFSDVIADMGYNEINWNIGCPFPMVTRKKRGSGILPYPDMIKKLLDIACAGKYTITVKMRLGLENSEEGMRVVEVLNEYPLGGVIIHARTGKQMYTGSVDLDSFEAIASACKHEITYNGDIFTYDDYLRISTRFPYIKNFMLGRGALSNPFLPSAIKGKTIPHEDKMSLLKEFHDGIFSYYKNTLSGDKHLCDKMKEFWRQLSAHTDKDGKLLKRIKKCHNSNDYLEAANQILSSSSMWSDSPIR